MQSLGAAKDFFFVLSPYSEGRRDWGLLRKDYSARPGYFAFATLTGELGDARYLGELAAPEGVRAFLFDKPEGGQSVVFWSRSELDTQGTGTIDSDQLKPEPRSYVLPAKDGNYTCRNLFGTPTPLCAANGKLELTADRYPAYVSGLSGLTASVPAPPQPAQTKQPVSDASTDLTIVMRVVLSDDFILNNGRDSVDMKADRGTLTLEICNLSMESKRGTVSVSGGTAEGMPKQVELAPMQKISMPLTFTPVFAEKKFSGKMEFSGRFNDKKTTRLHVPIRLLTREALTMKRQQLDGIYNAKRWHANSAGGNQMNIQYDEKEGAICFEAEFPPDCPDRWVYPEMELSLPRESFKNAVGVNFEIKCEADTAPKESYFMLVMRPDIVAGKGNLTGKGEWHVRYPIPARTWESRFVQFGEFVKDDPADTQKIRIGLNPKDNRIRYWIRNLQVIYK